MTNELKAERDDTEAKFGFADALAGRSRTEYRRFVAIEGFFGLWDLRRIFPRVQI